MKHRIYLAIIIISAFVSTSLGQALELDEGDILAAVGPAVIRVDPVTGDGEIVSGELSGVVVGNGPDLTGARPAAVEPSGMLVLANKESDNVIRIDPSTGDRSIVSGCVDSPVFPGCSLVGSGPGSFIAPTDLVVESDGNILVMDEGSGTVFRVDPRTGDRSIVSSNAVGTGPSFGIASLIQRESDGNILVFSRQFHALFRIDPVTGDRTVVSMDQVLASPVGDGPNFGDVTQMAAEADGSIVLTNIGAPITFGTTSVMRVDLLTGNRTVVSGCDEFLGTCLSVVGAGPDLASPRGIAVESDGNLIVSDPSAGPPPPGVVFRVDPIGGDRTIISSFTIGSGPVGVGVLTIVEQAANQPPIAVAGPDQAIRAGQTVFLDGSGSFDDNTDSSALVYDWSFSSLPQASTATLIAADTATPSFITDLADTYVVQLVVTDDGGLASSPDDVVISSENLAPTAAAGEDQLVTVGTTVILDGSDSTDPENNPLTYAWIISSSPNGSTAMLSDAASVSTSFVPDIAGSYAVTLSVSDFIGPGAPDTVDVIAAKAEDLAEIQIVSANDIVAGLGQDDVTTAGNQNAFGNFLIQAIVAIQAGDLAEAINKVEKALSRADGCVLRGAPDGNGQGRDWITNCTEQQLVYDALNSALTVLDP